ncbi:MAG: hypothetical protein ACRCT6_03995 [Notoacmeibacter sp.]
MRQVLILGSVLLATVASASASERYPTAKRYVNQTGEIKMVGQRANLAVYMPVQRVDIVPVVQTERPIRADAGAAPRLQHASIKPPSGFSRTSDN